MALSRYAYDLGVSLPDFLVRVHICADKEASTAVIASGKLKLDGVLLTDPTLILTSNLIRVGSVVEYEEQIVQLTFWDEYESGLR